MAKVKLPRDDPDGCWLWMACTSKDGYGQLTQQRKSCKAHRVAYEHFVAPIPGGLEIDHLCRRRNCVRPDHLEPVTRYENILRGESMTAVNARKTHCPKKHLYDMIDSDGGRRCRSCWGERVRVYGREWQLDNPEKCQERQRRYRLTHRKELAAKTRAAYAKKRAICPS